MPLRSAAIYYFFLEFDVVPLTSHLQLDARLEGICERFPRKPSNHVIMENFSFIIHLFILVHNTFIMHL